MAIEEHDVKPRVVVCIFWGRCAPHAFKKARALSEKAPIWT